MDGGGFGEELLGGERTGGRGGRGMRKGDLGRERGRSIGRGKVSVWLRASQAVATLGALRPGWEPALLMATASVRNCLVGRKRGFEVAGMRGRVTLGGTDMGKGKKRFVVL